MINNSLGNIFKNNVLIVTAWAWVTAQLIKVILGVAREKKFNFRWFVGTGGMPSAHSAGVSALALSCGLTSGFDSVIFAVSLMFAIVTMFDAQGVRHATGKQAEILNKVMEDIYWQGKIQEGRLKELIGHTPLEVLVGCLIGILVTFVLIHKLI